MPSEKVFLAYGSPASGKTTAFEHLREQGVVNYVSVGEVTRREISKKTPLGQELQRCLTEVVEYPPRLIAQVMVEAIRNAAKGESVVVVDGFPKYSREVGPFMKIISNADLVLNGVINFQLSLETAINRVENRRICTSCLGQVKVSSPEDNCCPHCNSSGSLSQREDDTPEVIKRRYGDYTRSYADTLNTIHTFFPDLEEYLVSAEGTEEEILTRLTILFDSARVAQQREQPNSIRKVGGSSPSPGSLGFPE